MNTASLSLCSLLGSRTKRPGERRNSEQESHSLIAHAGTYRAPDKRDNIPSSFGFEAE